MKNELKTKAQKTSGASKEQADLCELTLTLGSQSKAKKPKLGQAHFKSLLVRMATLPVSDQKWLLKQLSPEHQQCFEAQQGSDLLEKARRFNTLSKQSVLDIKPKPCLPKHCAKLQEQPDLYTAIVLDQGSFCWEEDFLKAHPRAQVIEALRLGLVQQIKTQTKACVLEHWQGHLSFDAHMEL